MSENVIPSSATSKKKSRRKLLLLLGLIVIILAFLAIGYTIVGSIFHSSASAKNYAAIEPKMDTVYKNMGLTNIDKAKVCYIYKDSMSEILKCSIEMAGYVPINDPSEISDIVEKFEKQLKQMNNNAELLTISDKFTIKSGSFSVNNKWSMGCLASVTKNYGMAIPGRGLPEKDLTGKLSLVLGCGGPSREAYFEME